MKLNWARSTDATIADADAPGAAPFELAAIDLITDAGRRFGWIATDGERTSDWLNAGDDVVVHGLRDVPLDDEISAPVMPGGQGLATHRLTRAEIIFAVPPPLPPNRHLRLHRRKVRINLEIGDYRVSGQLHVRPGADASDYILRTSRSMVPLTDVELVHTAEPEFRRLLPVLILNARRVTRMREADPQAAHRQPMAAPEASAPTPPAVPDAGGSAPSGTSAAQDPMAALSVLLDAGLLDLSEFQAKRAALLVRSRTGGGR